MAKKKIRKEEKKDSGIKTELIGMSLVLITIIGLCRFGILGSIIDGFAAFLVGTLWAVLLILVGLIGFYMIVKRKSFDLLTTKLFGLYIMTIGILSLFHLGYITNLNTEGIVDYGPIIEETFNNLNNFLDGTSDVQGGGMIGALASVTLAKGLTILGAQVVSIVIIIVGLIILTGITLYDIIKMLKHNTVKTINTLKPQKKIDVKKIEDDYENDNKVVVSSMEEVIKYQEPEINMHEVKQTHEINTHDDIETIELEDIINDNGKKPYVLPKIDLLVKNTQNNSKENQSVIKDVVELLQSVLNDFGIQGKVVAINIGPAVTQYELEIKAGTKLSKIVSLDKELALALAAKSVNIQAPIPGKKTVGVEIPNKKVTPVSVREILETVPKTMSDSKLLVTLGKDIMGKPIYCEINKTPHLLVAGSTGSGKSVCINSMLISLLMRSKPDEVKLVLVDPKKVELSMYNGVPHLLTPVVTDPKKANEVLKKIVVEMENRYELFERSGTKNIAGYNAYLQKKNNDKLLPYIVVIIDELADLMLVAAKEVEESIMRITQMARAAGIHLIVATQRPSTDVITGVVKANIPSRISFAVSSSIDSRTILDKTGAEKLLGKGDMLFMPQGENVAIRVQGTFISDEEIKEVVDYTVKQQIAQYDETYNMSAPTSTNSNNNEADEEPLYNEIVEFVVTSKKASASLLQRRFRLGYNRAARAIDLLEQRGIIGPSNGSKPREVLIQLESE